MARLKVTRAAARDLVGIGDYTFDRWGEEQCALYLRRLDARFHALAKAPRSGRPCDDLRPGYWLFHEGRHVIFYRVAGKAVEIVRVLHDRMLPRLHL